MTTLISLPIEIQLKIYSFALASFSVEISYEALIYCKIDHVPEEDSYRSPRTAGHSTTELKRLWFAKSQEYRRDSGWNELLYICKTILPIAVEARLRAFDGQVIVRTHLRYLVQAIERYMSMPRYKHFLQRVRCLTYDHPSSSDSKAILTLARMLPTLQAVECKLRGRELFNTLLRPCHQPSNYNALQEPSYIFVLEHKKEIERGDYDHLFIDSIPATSIVPVAQELDLKGFGHIQTFLTIIYFWGDYDVDETPSLVITYAMAQNRMQPISRRLGLLCELVRLHGEIFPMNHNLREQTLATT